MEKTFAARHFECSDTLKEYCLNAVDKLETFHDRIVVADIILEPTQNPAKPQQAEVLVQIPGDLLTTKTQALTYELAMHECIENLVRQIKKFKAKRADH